jgi:spore coat protein A
MTDYYELTERVAKVELLPGTSTTVRSYNGAFPGPLIRARRGRTASVHVRNQLDVGTVVHLHGGVTPPDSDGFPMDLIPPGGERPFVYPNDHPAATLWYHDHAMDHTGQNIYMGWLAPTSSRTNTRALWVCRMGSLTYRWSS